MMLVQQPLLQAQKLVAWLSGYSAASVSSSSALGQIQETPPVNIAAISPLFGDKHPWNQSGKVTWISVDDRVRGGSSQSNLEEKSKDGALLARFYGTLDTRTLGGAGFASVTTEYKDDGATSDLSSYDGILIRVADSDRKRYTFILKDEVPGRGDDGRMKSGISWEYDFYGVDGLASTDNGLTKERSHTYSEIYIPWSKFKATFRGKDVKDADPLKTNHVKRYSLMARSFFAQQDGEFDITFHSISAYSAKKDSGPKSVL